MKARIRSLCLHIKTVGGLSMKKNFSKFMRGQIWMWKDPIYGYKPQGFAADSAEGSLRYSRPVLILQGADTYSDASFLVAPLTTQSGHPYSITLQMPNGNMSNIRINKITSVHPRQLTDYVCTLGDPIMEIVDVMIRHLLLEEPIDKEWLDSVQPHIVMAPEFNATTKGASMMAKVDETITNSIDQSGIDLPDPVERLSEIAKQVEESPNLPEMVPNDEIATEEPVKEPTKSSPGPKLLWTTERKFEFVRTYDFEGVDATAEKFKIKTSSVYKYIKKFRKDLATEMDGQTNEVSSDTIIEAPNEEESNVVYSTADVPSVNTAKKFTINTEHFMNGISQWTNFVVAYCKEQHVDNVIALYWNPKKNNNKLASRTGDGFFAQLSSSIYFSLLKYFSITKVRDDLIPAIPDVYEGSELYDSAKAIHRFTKIAVYNTELKSATSQIGEWKKKHIPFKIGRNWLSHIEAGIQNRFNLNKKGIQKILDCLETFIVDEE